SATPAVAAAAPCSTCAFWVPLSGSFRTLFGACANEWSPSDGRVVSVDHGCGAHSQTEAERRLSEWPGADPIVDSGAIDALDLVTEPEPESELEDETDQVDVDGEAAETVENDETVLVDELADVEFIEVDVSDETITEVEVAEAANAEAEFLPEEPDADESAKDEAAAE
ncbi:MAG: DUF3027 domain-containing protein, partial [Demequinaceae bacterium]|nr:DUF3027 domain-containing protein [Demequinaceae bacterium]